MERKYKYLGMVNIGNILCSIIRYSMGSSIVFMTHFTDQETGIGSKYTPLGLNVSPGSFWDLSKIYWPFKVHMGSCSNSNSKENFQNQTYDLKNCSTYEWTEVQQGYILGSYYYGYFIASIFINSILNFFSPQERWIQKIFNRVVYSTPRYFTVESQTGT